jgi:methionyl-tRNA synthetase
MVGRFLGGRIPIPGEPDTPADRTLRETAEALAGRVGEAMRVFAFHKALESIWELLDAGNRYIDEAKPWELAKRDPAAVARVLGHACEALRLAALQLSPFIPEAAERMWTRLGLVGPLAGTRLETAGRWGAAAARDAVPGEALFPRVDVGGASAAAPAVAAPAPVAAPEAAASLSLDEFRKVDLRVAEILEATAVPGSKKLVQLTVSLGPEQRTVVAGILLDYPPSQLVGKQIVVVANLQPAKLMGVESRGMLLAATGADGKLVLVAPERRAVPGATVK